MENFLFKNGFECHLKSQNTEATAIAKVNIVILGLEKKTFATLIDRSSALVSNNLLE